ncbi:MAG: ROK family protein [Mycolicibacterium rufum]|nr:ROK family protein [Mycolicibacterium rufum]
MSTAYTLAIDIGGTKLISALIDATGHLLQDSLARETTGTSESASLVSRLRAAVSYSSNGLPDGGVLDGIGISCAGPIDHARGTTACANLPGLAGIDLRSLVSNTLAKVSNESVHHGFNNAARQITREDVMLAHDGTCAVVGEHWVGAARETRNAMAIVVSTGVGGGIIIGGRPLRGKTGNCGHIGQIQVGPREPGATSLTATLEHRASGPAATDWAAARGWTGSSGVALARDAGNGNRIALAAVRRSAIFVGEAVASMCALLDLEVVTIGGGFSQAAPNYVTTVADTARECAFLPHAASAEILRSSLGDNGSLIGAAALVKRHTGHG